MTEKEPDLIIWISVNALREIISISIKKEYVKKS